MEKNKELLVQIINELLANQQPVARQLYLQQLNTLLRELEIINTSEE